MIKSNYQEHIEIISKKKIIVITAQDFQTCFVINSQVSAQEGSLTGPKMLKTS